MRSQLDELHVQFFHASWAIQTFKSTLDEYFNQWCIIQQIFKIERDAKLDVNRNWIWHVSTL